MQYFPFFRSSGEMESDWESLAKGRAVVLNGCTHNEFLVYGSQRCCRTVVFSYDLGLGARDIEFLLAFLVRGPEILYVDWIMAFWFPEMLLLVSGREYRPFEPNLVTMNP